MHRKELNERSPLRVFEKSMHGGLGAGNLGAVIARNGVGKTACLVGIALDDLLRGKKVLHISQQHPVEKVRAYYDDIFADLAHEKELADVWKVRAEMERDRRIHHYTGHSFTTEKLEETLGFLSKHGDFAPSAVLIDDFDARATSKEELQALRAIAGRASAEMWVSSTIHRPASLDERGIPEPFSTLSDAIDVILHMAHDGNAVHISLLKDHDAPTTPELKLALDPRTMLLVRS